MDVCGLANVPGSHVMTWPLGTGGRQGPRTPSAGLSGGGRAQAQGWLHPLHSQANFIALNQEPSAEAAEVGVGICMIQFLF